MDSERLAQTATPTKKRRRCPLRSSVVPRPEISQGRRISSFAAASNATLWSARLRPARHTRAIWARQVRDVLRAAARSGDRGRTGGQGWIGGCWRRQPPQPKSGVAVRSGAAESRALRSRKVGDSAAAERTATPLFGWGG